MVKLIVDHLSETRPHLLAPLPDSVDPIRTARFPAGNKRDLLEILLKDAGPVALLSIGQQLKSATVDPLWRVALNSATVDVLFHKWRNFEAFAHWKNRLQIKQIAEHRAYFRRYAVEGDEPTEAENLLLCGVMIALMDAIGCRALSCEMPTENPSSMRIYRDGNFVLPDKTGLISNTWELSWEGFEPQHVLQNEAPTASDVFGQKEELRTIAPAMDQLTRDPARQWKLSELAEACAMSQRTLQRRLTEAGYSFSQLVRAVRVHEACRLLEQLDLPITVIGFCSGFCDSSHFSRDFNASMGMTPTNYREICNR